MTDFHFCKLLASGEEAFRAEFASPGNDLRGWGFCSSEVRMASAMVAFAMAANTYSADLWLWSASDLKDILLTVFPNGTPLYVCQRINALLAEGASNLRVIVADGPCQICLSVYPGARFSAVDRAGVYIVGDGSGGALYVGPFAAQPPMF